MMGVGNPICRMDHIFFVLIACGYTFCDTCTSHRIAVPLLDTQTPERVCDNCYEQIQSRTLSSVLRNVNSQYQEEQTMEDGANNNNNSANAKSYGRCSLIDSVLNDLLFSSL